MLRSTMSHPEAARMSFDLISNLVTDGPDMLVSLDNFSGLVSLLDNFAMAASALTESHQHRNRRVEPLTSSKYATTLK
jgi:brefeldin A-resistance guanine nucleotide exchange factor 1